MSSIIFGLSQHRNKQHQQTVTVHLPIYWGTTRLLFIRPPELEPTIYPWSVVSTSGDYDIKQARSRPKYVLTVKFEQYFPAAKLNSKI